MHIKHTCGEQEFIVIVHEVVARSLQIIQESTKCLHVALQLGNLLGDGDEFVVVLEHVLLKVLCSQRFRILERLQEGAHRLFTRIRQILGKI